MHSPHPRKVYVELTTRCNLQCPMCLKFSEGSCIEEGDLPLALFKKLAPSLAHTEFLVLNGIGEPLLHPDLEEIIAIARAVMPAQGRIGFQSNGLLFNQARALGLIEAGLDTVCLSLDNLDAGDAGNGPQKGHQFTAVNRALAHLLQAREMLQKPVRLGIEVVLQRKTLHQLQDLVVWAGAHQIDFILASHLFSYDGSLAEQSLFNPNSYEATELFAKWAAAAQAQGVQLADLPAAQRKFYKNPAERLLVQLGEAMWQEAREKNIDYHFSNLVTQSEQDMEEVEAYFRQAKQSAQQGGIDLFLPPLHAQATGQRSCPFIDDEAIFIDTKGKVMPCHFLWHTCPGQVNKGTIQVEARVLGSITEEPLETIWQKETAAAFRAEAGKRDYAPCWSCTSAPCADLVNDNLLGMHDCYGSHVPCGHCMWAIGWLKCL